MIFPDISQANTTPCDTKEKQNFSGAIGKNGDNTDKFFQSGMATKSFNFLTNPTFKHPNR